MARYQVILAYDGTDFSGFQRQAKKKGSRTVQEVIENALAEIGWQGRSIMGAGRTDTGVHASGQVAAFDLDWEHPAEDLLAALNAYLPRDTAIQDVRLASPDFHPRFDARARHYRYQIFCQPVRDPIRERYFWRVWPSTDLERLSTAAALLTGIHDYGAFGSPPKPGGTTVREVFKAHWNSREDELIFDITGNAFLFRMVRRLVKMQVSIGQGKLEVDSVRRCLLTGEKNLVGGLAPAHGLTLVEVLYSDPLTEYTG